VLTNDREYTIFIYVSNKDTKEIQMSYKIERLQHDPANYTADEVTETITLHYDSIALRVKGFASGVFDKRGLIVNGPAGGGKTEIVNAVLKQCNSDYKIISGTITAPRLFVELYKKRKPGQILVIDDTDAIIENTEMSDILKGAIDTGAPKEISYNKRSIVLHEADCPNNFVFAGGVILITNKHININSLTPREEQRIKPIWGRCNYILAGLSPAWTVEAMQLLFKNGKIRCLNESNLPPNIKKELFDFVIERFGDSHSMSFRTIITCIDMYRLDPDNWREYVLMGAGNTQ